MKTSRFKAVRLIGLLLLFLALLPSLLVAGQTDASVIHVIAVDGEITPAMAAYLESKIEEANLAGAAGIVIAIRTLGGRVDSAIQMKDAILASRAPVAVYIENRAISAGALISIAAETIVMAPGSHIGSAKPEPSDPKIIAFVSGEFRTTAERTGRDPRVAVAMVDESVVIEGLVGEGEILDLTAGEALTYGYADHIANGLEAALQALGWDTAGRVEVKMDFRHRIAQFLTSVEVATLLLSLGTIALIAEFYTPGFGVSGTIGIIFFILYFSGGFIAGYTDFWAAAIFLIGLVLIAIELVVPGFGVFGIAGLISLVTSVILAAPTARQGVFYLLIALVSALVAIPLFFKIFGRSKLVRRLVLEHAETVENGYVHAIGPSDLTGRSGIALTVLRPAGVVLVEGVRTDAVSQGDFIAKGDRIRVVQTAGTRVVVTPVQEQPTESQAIP
jgi:membrane-bound serine protease (ClpP class)